MVVKVSGKIDGKEVIFERAEGDRWNVTVPYDLDGMYVVELTAENDAGNIAYCTKILLIVDPATLCVRLVPLDYMVEIVPEDCKVTVIPKDYAVEAVPEQYQVIAEPDPLFVEVIYPIHGRVVVNKIRFILGEDKHVKLLVRSPNDEPFTILTASYELARYTDIVVQGECDINEHYLDCKIAPEEKGTHILEVTYTVADSIRKARIEVEVV